jgi:hypothetical protein
MCVYACVRVHIFKLLKTKLKMYVFVFVILKLENGYIDFHQTWQAYFLKPET